MKRPDAIDKIVTARNAMQNFKWGDNGYDFIRTNYGVVADREWPSVLAYIEYLEGVTNGLRS